MPLKKILIRIPTNTKWREHSNSMEGGERLLKIDTWHAAAAYFNPSLISLVTSSWGEMMARRETSAVYKEAKRMTNDLQNDLPIREAKSIPSIVCDHPRLPI